MGTPAVRPVTGAAPVRARALAAKHQLKELGPWELYGDNGYQECVRFDVTGDSKKSWCWKRRPGLNGGLPWGNGGVKQTINLLAGVQYELTADLAFLCTC